MGRPRWPCSTSGCRHPWQLAENLRTCEQLPIIFLSANVDQQHIDRGRELGAVYLTKPYVRSALCKAIDRAVTKPDGW